MPIYNVTMGQAISIHNIGADTLMTGCDVKSGLMSCSAIILFNRANGAAGLYHYPSGDIRARPSSQQVLREMMENISPTDCHVVYGAEDLTSNPFSFGFARDAEPTDPYHDHLLLHLRSLGLNPRTVAAGGSRSASVSLAGGTWTVSRDMPDGAVQNLAGRANAHGLPWCRIYWSMMAPFKLRPRLAFTTTRSGCVIL